MDLNLKDRRPITTRDKRWAKDSARWLKNKGVTPNQISVASMAFALVSGLSFLLAFYVGSAVGRGIFLLLAALMIQGRLICNLLDGMVAVKGGMGSPAGPVYNELPDRVSDTLILLGVGYSLTAWPEAAILGWAAALLALMTAYLRLLGGTCGLKQQFLGPMAKQHRMAILCAGAVVAIFLPVQWGQLLLLTCLIIICLGALVTCWRRGAGILRDLHTQADKQGNDDGLSD